MKNKNCHSWRRIWWINDNRPAPTEYKRNEADIVLINQHHYHYETTWLHETSAGTLCEQEVTYRIEDVIDGKKVQLIEDTVKKIDAKKRQVILANGSVDYDYLVIALGGETEAHGIKGLNTYGYTISNVETAKKINAHIEKQFSLYTSEKAGPLLKIVVGGAGFTGIEFVGELTESIPRLCKSMELMSTWLKFTV